MSSLTDTDISSPPATEAILFDSLLTSSENQAKVLEQRQTIQTNIPSNDVIRTLENVLSLIFSLLSCQIFAILNSAVGIIDDLKKLKRKKNKGLSAGGKLLLQLLLATAFLFARSAFIGDTPDAAFSFGDIYLGYAYYPIALFILLGIVNCANLTDGIDGLASSVAFAVGVSLLYISAALNPEVALVSSALIGGTVGFLIFNLHPAKIFMGDTGSLYLGALIAATSISLDNPILIIFICGVYVL